MTVSFSFPLPPPSTAAVTAAGTLREAQSPNMYGITLQCFFSFTLILIYISVPPVPCKLILHSREEMEISSSLPTSSGSDELPLPNIPFNQQSRIIPNSHNTFIFGLPRPNSGDLFPTLQPHDRNIPIHQYFQTIIMDPLSIPSLSMDILPSSSNSHPPAPPEELVMDMEDMEPYVPGNNEAFAEDGSFGRFGEAYQGLMFMLPIISPAGSILSIGTSDPAEEFVMDMEPYVPRSSEASAQDGSFRRFGEAYQGLVHMLPENMVPIISAPSTILSIGTSDPPEEFVMDMEPYVPDNSEASAEDGSFRRFGESYEGLVRMLPIISAAASILSIGTSEQAISKAAIIAVSLCFIIEVVRQKWSNCLSDSTSRALKYINATLVVCAVALKIFGQ